MSNNKLTKIEIEIKTYETLKDIMKTCIEDMLNAGIPVRDDRIIGIGIRQLDRTRAGCYFKTMEDGFLSFFICIHKKVTKHLDDSAVMENVKNSIYHELLHTCDNCQSHNDEWMKWSKICDEKLGTHTRRHIEEKLYYNPSLTPIVYRCENCGNEYWTTEEFTDTCNCELCRKNMGLV